MHLRRRIQLRDESGTTLVELMVGMGMGMVVLAGLSIVLIVTLHGNARVGARVEATDNARVVMTRIIEELHSACVSQVTAPVKMESSKNTLIFTHGTYGSTATTTATESPTFSKITYSPTSETLTQTDESSESRILLSHVSPIPEEPRVFSYWKYENGSLSQLPESESIGIEGPQLSEKEANATILVKIAFEAHPKSEPVSDAGAATAVRNSATLRLTPPEYNATKVQPCQ
jgi:hypothetical protein